MDHRYYYKKVDDLRVKIKTKEGYELVRVLKVDSELQKDGSAYLVEEKE